MPYVKVTGYIKVPDEYYRSEADKLLTVDGYEETELVPVGLLDDLCIEPDDRGDMR